MTPRQMKAAIVQRIAAYWLLVATVGVACYWLYKYGLAGLLAAGVLIAVGLMAV